MQNIDTTYGITEQRVAVVRLDITSEQVQIAAEIENSVDIRTEHDVVVLFVFAFAHFIFHDTDILVKLGQ